MRRYEIITVVTAVDVDSISISPSWKKLKKEIRKSNVSFNEYLVFEIIFRHQWLIEWK